MIIDIFAVSTCTIAMPTTFVSTCTLRGLGFLSKDQADVSNCFPTVDKDAGYCVCSASMATFDVSLTISTEHGLCSEYPDFYLFSTRL